MAMTMMRRERAQEEDVIGNDEDEGRGGGYDVYKTPPQKWRQRRAREQKTKIACNNIYKPLPPDSNKVHEGGLAPAPT